MLESNNVNSVTNRNNLFFDNIFCLPCDECIGLSDPTLRLTGSVGVCFQSVGPLPYAYSLYKIPPLNFGVGGPYKFPKFTSIQFIRNLERFNIFRWKKKHINIYTKQWFPMESVVPNLFVTSCLNFVIVMCRSWTIRTNPFKGLISSLKEWFVNYLGAVHWDCCIGSSK